LDNLNFNTKLVGNIGNPVLDEINLLKHDNYDYVIYELSSYMLETCEPACDIAVL
jgi:UDP-N-acetylmuramoylalanine-D-glutamate ligase